MIKLQQKLKREDELFENLLKQVFIYSLINEISFYV